MDLLSLDPFRSMIFSPLVSGRFDLGSCNLDTFPEGAGADESVRGFAHSVGCVAMFACPFIVVVCGLIHLNATAWGCTQLSGFYLIADCRMYSLTDSPLAWTTPQLITAFPLSIEIRQLAQLSSFNENYSHVCVRNIWTSIRVCVPHKDILVRDRSAKLYPARPRHDVPVVLLSLTT